MTSRIVGVVFLIIEALLSLGKKGIIFSFNFRIKKRFKDKKKASKMLDKKRPTKLVNAL